MYWTANLIYPCAYINRHQSIGSYLKYFTHVQKWPEKYGGRNKQESFNCPLSFTTSNLYEAGFSAVAVL